MNRPHLKRRPGTAGISIRAPIQIIRFVGAASSLHWYLFGIACAMAQIFVSVKSNYRTFNELYCSNLHFISTQCKTVNAKYFGHSAVVVDVFSP